MSTELEKESLNRLVCIYDKLKSSSELGRSGVEVTLLIEGIPKVERNGEIRVQVTTGVTCKLTVKEVLVVYFLENLRCIFDFVDLNSS